MTSLVLSLSIEEMMFGKLATETKPITEVMRIECQGGRADTLHFIDCSETTTIFTLSSSKPCEINMRTCFI